MEAADVEVRDSDDHAAAGAVLGRAMADNPTHRAVFRRDRDSRERILTALLGTALTRFGRPFIGAFAGERLVGVVAGAPPRQCRPPVRDDLALAPIILRAGPVTTMRTARWLGTWARLDPREPHFHLGPVGVEPEFQGQGIATRLLAVHAQRLDDAGQLGYLETDKPENVRLYERFGYQVVRERTVLGVRQWFMTRDPAAG